MQRHPDRHPVRPPSLGLTAMPLLFARYVAGQIEDPFWDQFMQVLDANDTPADDRLALAAFFNDAFAELEPSEVKLPRHGEVEELLREVRSPRRKA